jgi:hypothetical protein
MDTLSAIFEFLQTLPGILIILFVGTGTLLTCLVTAWAKNWREVRLALAASELKAKMIDRGMSADEIERVLAADTAGSTRPKPPAPPKGGSALQALIENGTDASGIKNVIEAGLPVVDDPNDVVRMMAENGYDGDDIASVVAALRSARRSVSLPAPAAPAPAPRPDSRPMADIDLEMRDPKVTAGV